MRSAPFPSRAARARPQGPTPPTAPGSAPAPGARRGQGRSSAAAAPAGRSAGGGRVAGRPRRGSREAALLERRAGRCCWGEKRRHGPAPSPAGAAPSSGIAAELHAGPTCIYSDDQPEGRLASGHEKVLAN